MERYPRMLPITGLTAVFASPMNQSTKRTPKVIIAATIWLRVSVDANVPRAIKEHPSKKRPPYPQRIGFQDDPAIECNMMTPGRVAAMRMAKVVRHAANLAATVARSVTG